MSQNIKFTASGSCNAIGNFAPGDIARNVPDALAHHLVKEAMCAKYMVAPASPIADPEKTDASPRRRSKSIGKKDADTQ